MRNYLEKYSLILGLIVDIITVILWGYKKEVNIYILILLLVSIVFFVQYFIWVNRTIKSNKLDLNGLSLDILNISRMNQKTNDNLILQSVNKELEIRKKSLKITSTYKGKAKNKCDGIFLNMGAHDFTHNQDNYFGYDLKNDPTKRKKILFELKSPKGIVNTFFMPFMKEINKNDFFSVESNFFSEAGMQPGIDFCFSKLPFKKSIFHKKLYEFKIILKFVDYFPKWVKCYEVRENIIEFKYFLNPVETIENYEIYIDQSENVSADCIRVYMFEREI